MLGSVVAGLRDELRALRDELRAAREENAKLRADLEAARAPKATRPRKRRADGPVAAVIDLAARRSSKR